MNISQIAAKHNIDSNELAAWVDGRGWDFSRLDYNNPEHVQFAANVIDGYAQEIAAHHARKAARAAQQAAARLAAVKRGGGEVRAGPL